MEKRRRFSEEFKREAVRLAFETNRRISDVARELDMRPDQLRRWRKKFSEVDLSEPTEVEEELRRTRRELSRVREERDILKKALAIFSDRQP